MTFLGKIFTLLIMIMSLLFMFLAVVVFATHKNWRTVVDNPTPKKNTPLGLKQRIEQQQQTLQGLQSERNEALKAIEREQAARKFALAALQAKLTLAQERQKNAELQYEKLLETSKAQADAVKSKSEALATVTKNVETLRQQIRDSQRQADDHFVQVVALNDSINQLRGLQVRAEERNVQLAQQLSRAKAVLMANDLEMYARVGPPKVDGLVMAVLRDRVEISIGSDEGLKPGDELDVWRGETYLGRIVIRRTEPDKSVGDVIPAFRRSSIRKGDRVATQLS